MQYWLLFIPLIGALIGWSINSLLIFLLFHPAQPKKVLGLTFHGLVLKKQKSFAKQVAVYVSTQLFSIEEIKNKLTNPENAEKLMPFVEAEIDHFLRQKLTEQMPMIGMLIGEKTIVQLKGIFVEEIRILFPKLITNYIENIEADMNIAAMIEEKIGSVSADTIKKIICTNLKKELTFFKLAGAVIGFLTGLIQLVIALFL
jgi:uncharacterized membrane protein YheB (UPF0754 family)